MLHGTSHVSRKDKGVLRGLHGYKHAAGKGLRIHAVSVVGGKADKLEWGQGKEGGDGGAKGTRKTVARGILRSLMGIW